MKNNKELCITTWIFVLVSAIFVVYASLTMRGMYEDGAFFFINVLNGFAQNNYTFSIDTEHPRFFILMIMQFPLWICNFFHIRNKTTLMMIFSFVQFFFPLLILWWNYKLTQRTKRNDVFFWHVFTYCTILITFSIFSVVESLIGAGLHFILWNYLVSNIDYKKRDILLIIFLLTVMFATYEYVVFLGIIFFIAHFHCVLEEKSVKNQCVKTLIGFGCLAASIYNIYFMLHVSGEGGEISRFMKEGFDYLPHAFDLCSLFSIITIVLLIFFAFKKTKLNFIQIGLCSLFFIVALIKMLKTPLLSVYPMWEQHLRTIPCWGLPIIFIIMDGYNKFKKEVNLLRFNNLICIVLICGIFQTIWQINNTYYWNKNIEYMKSELKNSNTLLYIPSEHEEISGFHNEKLRRYIWHGIFVATSILFSDTKEQKTLLMNYDVQQDPGNNNFREALYVVDKDTISIPYATRIKIKNRYWDLQKCAAAVNEYNKKHNFEYI